MLLTSGAWSSPTRTTSPFPLWGCHLLIFKMLWHHLQEVLLVCFVAPHPTAKDDYSGSGPRAKVLGSIPESVPETRGMQQESLQPSVPVCSSANGTYQFLPPRPVVRAVHVNELGRIRHTQIHSHKGRSAQSTLPGVSVWIRGSVFLFFCPSGQSAL